MSKQVKRLYEFEPFILDATERVLRRNGREVRLTLKQYEVLLILIENSGHIVERKAIMQRGWPDSFVEDAVITQNISGLKKMLREEDDTREYIETIAKRGYRFTAPVKLIEEKVESLALIRNSVSSASDDLVPTYSDVGAADSNGRYRLKLDATINDIDKAIAEAIEAILRKVSDDVTVTIRKIDEGSVILTLEGTRAGFERIRELVESGKLTEILGFDIEDLRWEVSSERLEMESPHTTLSYPEGLLRLGDRAVPTEGALPLAQLTFDRFLLLLGTDRDQAAIRYEQLRRRLIRIFASRGAIEAEELADETISRVAKKIESGVEIPTTSLEAYFFGVARNVWKSYLTRSVLAYQMPEAAKGEGVESQSGCFEQCLLSLSDEERKLVLAYYADSGKSKTTNRKHLATRLGMSSHALRIRVSRIRQELRKCISDCLKQSQKES